MALERDAETERGSLKSRDSFSSFGALPPITAPDSSGAGAGGGATGLEGTLNGYFDAILAKVEEARKGGLQVQQQSASQALGRASKEHSAAVDRLKADYEARLKAAADAQACTQAEVDQLKSQADGLGAGNAALEQENAGLKQQLERLRADHATATASTSTANARIEALGAQAAEADAAKTKLSASIKNLKEKVKAGSTEIGRLKELLAKEAAQREQAGKAHAEEQRKAGSLAKKSKDEVSKLQKQLLSLTEELDKLQKSQSASEVTLKKTKRAHEEAAKKRDAQHQARLKESQQKMDGLSQRHAKETKELRQRIETLEARLVELEADDDLTRKMESLIQQNRKEKRRLSEKRRATAQDR